jgi:hypothetical protein
MQNASINRKQANITTPNTVVAKFSAKSFIKHADKLETQIKVRAKI